MWQPIETAPRDGTRILVWNNYIGPYSSEYVDGHWPMGLQGGDFGRWYPVPTHWMHLPDGPPGAVDGSSMRWFFPSARWNPDLRLPEPPEVE